MRKDQVAFIVRRLSNEQSQVGRPAPVVEKSFIKKLTKDDVEFLFS